MIRTFAVNVFDGPASTDAATGKAERKFLAAVYQKLTNEIIPVADMEELAEGTTETEPRTEAGESKAETVHKQLTAGTTTYVQTPATVEPEKVPVPVQEEKPAEKQPEKSVEHKPEEKPATGTKKSIFDEIDDEHEKTLRREEQMEQFRNSAGK
jgi:flagellar biosynthesis component FlhA